LNIQTKVEEQTPLHLACEISNYDTVSVLCENGSDLFIRNKQNKTPFTSVKNNLLMVKMLKKYERSYFEKNLHARDSRKIKELHLINKNFLADSQP
jgi:ankyrin repeat protein